MVETWEADRKKPNPFARTVANKTEAAMHLQLAQEDAQDELAGLNGDELHTTSPKDMISQGIQLELSQIKAWFVVQEVRMPTVRGLRIHDSLGEGPSLPAYSLPLYLPSSILPAHGCAETLIQAESHLHIAQGYDLLHTIRSQLLALSKSYKDGDTNVLTQKEQLKCHKTTWDLNVWITQAKQYYCDVRKWLVVLSTEIGEWDWQVQLRILEDTDVHRIADDEVGISEGNRSMSWTWYSSHLGDVPGGVEECLRIEWCKTRARAHQ
ncbi:hypothetical protein ARMSODRAFT_1026235 [Armillaria solidipes]|uniref:Uncharacterized protein n=1 Tax=Armillaria solidipes TaxID=1076256 RepID=A0A2H3B470_9AGAR|nr:hypothetical protein ARMSODRAFT_1026235 [Armillaria solidipes]